LLDAEEYYGSYERSIASLVDLHEREGQVQAFSDATGLRFFWRGQSDAAWGVHSSLHRRLAIHTGVQLEALSEPTVVAKEREIVNSAREWVRPAVGARLTSVDLLARLQHFGVPTRFIDFTRAAKIATYFAVSANPGTDGRLIIAAARRAPSDDFRNSFVVPWATGSSTYPTDWPSHLYLMDDHADFLRIIEQSGVFLTGGTPSSRPRRRTAAGVALTASDARRAMSIPLSLHSWTQAEELAATGAISGRVPTIASVLTLRVPHAAKSQVRRDLEAEGYTMKRLFPDPDGYRQYDTVVRALLS
jgi:hypothetical protein